MEKFYTPLADTAAGTLYRVNPPIVRVFVLELTGDTVQLIPPPDGFVPKQW
jgi:hypothetical protein